ncbi:MAG: DUF4174 domain-containing protein [Roseicyclus sp.]|jgi:hypothetical protein
MRPIFLVFPLLLSLATQAPAQAEDSVAMAAADTGETATEAVDPMAPRNAVDLTLAEFQWVARPIIVFADTPQDPRFIEQMQLLAERPEPLLERDVVILFDTDPQARSAIRTELRPRGFAVVILQIDGSLGVRRPSPRDVREITRIIDNFAFRQEELRSSE